MKEFGPIKSGICACEQCGVGFVDSRIRRYQMGYIKLACRNPCVVFNAFLVILRKP